jgi:hypothetical protein
MKKEQSPDASKAGETKLLTGPVTANVILPGTKRKAIQREFIGRDIREAQRIADGDSGKLIYAIIAVTTTIEGEPVTVEDIDAMNGLDVLELMKGFGGNFTLAPNS